MRFLLSLLFVSLTSSAILAETLGDRVQSVSDGIQQLQTAPAASASEWAKETLDRDLRIMVDDLAELQTKLEGNDASALGESLLQLRSASRRLETSKVLLPENEQAKLEALLSSFAPVHEKLSHIRERFSGLAPSVEGSLASLSVDAELGGDSYINVQELLIDVRSARELASSLNPGRFPQYGLNAFGPNNPDSQQVRRVVRASWALERRLSPRMGDVRNSKPQWERFYREYNRLGYGGRDSVQRRLDRVVSRLEDFYQAF